MARIYVDNGSTVAGVADQKPERLGEITSFFNLNHYYWDFRICGYSVLQIGGLLWSKG